MIAAIEGRSDKLSDAAGIKEAEIENESDAAMIIDTLPAGSSAKRIIRHFLTRSLNLHIALVPDDLGMAYYHHIADASLQFMKKHSKQIERARSGKTTKKTV